MPEIKIQDLLDAINKDGIDKAEAEAQRIISQAKDKAQRIIFEAQERSDSMISAAKAECDAFSRQAEAMLRQAADNVCVALKAELNSMLGRVIRKTLSSQMGSAAVAELAREAIRQSPSKDVTLELSGRAYEYCASLLANEVSNGLVLRLNESIKEGFRLSEKDGSGYYDFSPEELKSLIMPYLSQSLSKVLMKE